MNRLKGLRICGLTLLIVVLVGVYWAGMVLSNEDPPRVSGTWIMEISITFSGGEPDCICGPLCNNSLLGHSDTYIFNVQQLGSSFYSDSWLPTTISGTINDTSIIIFSVILPGEFTDGCTDYVDFSGQISDYTISGSFSGHDCIYNCVWAGDFYVDIIPVTATIDIDPDTLNLKSKIKWVTAYIELPGGYNVADIDVGTVKLWYEGSSVPAELGDIQDGTLVVKFDGAAVQDLFIGPVDAATVAVAGELQDGTPFGGNDTIRVIEKGKP